ncbi:hypothetical protein HYS54_00810 [Candidatus Micrarchaeota archaeon]|nr:hypothetical protein [Candidatus Micrarchaeota archaeon]
MNPIRAERTRARRGAAYIREAEERSAVGEERVESEETTTARLREALERQQQAGEEEGLARAAHSMQEGTQPGVFRKLGKLAIIAAVVVLLFLWAKNARVFG